VRHLLLGLRVGWHDEGCPTYGTILGLRYRHSTDEVLVAREKDKQLVFVKIKRLHVAQEEIPVPPPYRSAT
jgi:hypothetical protein